MRKSVRALCVAVAFTGGLLFAAAPALASGSHVFSMSFGSAGSGAGQLSLSGYGGVAVNAATHDVYVADAGNNRVDQFSATGAFVRAWGWGVADGLPSFETCTLTCQAGTQGSGAGQLSNPTFIAVDNSSGASAGDVYVGDANNLVSKFSAEGAYISSNDGSGASAPIAGPFGALAGIAVDGSGDLWVYDENANMFEFAQDGSFVTDWNSGRGVTPYGIDVDAAGNLYVLTGGGSIEQFTSSGADVGPVNGDASDPSGFSVDRSSGDVYMDSGHSLIRHYEASCDAGGSCTAADTFGSGVLGESWGLGVDSSNGAVYVADSLTKTISLFVGPTPAAPDIDGTSAAEVTGSSATLRAVINPHLLSTTYHFEYGTSGSYGQSTPQSASIGSDYAEHNVTAHLQGLAPSTTYHLRIVATNSASPGGVAGPDRTITTQPAGNAGGADTCPNAATRAQQHAAALPDCRVYEQVSPTDKGGAPILGATAGGRFWQASADGSAVVFSSSGAFADALTGEALVLPYLASRGQGGWATHSLLPPQAPGGGLAEPHISIYTEDLARGILLDGRGAGEGLGSAGQDQPLLVPGEPANNRNIFLRDNLTNSYRLVDVTPPGVTAAGAEVSGASSDLSHVFFTESAQLTADSPPAGEQPHLFEWSSGVVRLAGILPDGSAVPASQRLQTNSVSENGSRVFFSNVSAGAQALYLRQDATSTVQVDASHGPGPGGEGEFAAASSDGSLAFFLDDAARGLTNDTVSDSGANLYRYDANAGTLTDLTPVAGAEVQGVMGASHDGSHVYFVADGVLAPGASAGDCGHTSATEKPETETCNLYLLHGGVTTFIAALNGEDVHGPLLGYHIFRNTGSVSPSGRYLAFESLNSLTGYDNLAANGVQCGHTERVLGGEPQPRCSELYLYDAAAGPSGKLSCASCNPSGGAPTGPARTGPTVSEGGADRVRYTPRSLLDSGRLFFDSGDAIVPQDVNGQQDVYEFEPGGVGGCGQASGCVSLISSGRSPDVSTFFDASVTGDDVFFTTSDPLVAQDGDQVSDLYDARVGGGIASQNVVSVPPCSGESCKAHASTPPGEQTPSSSGFSGPGNLTPAGVPSSHGKPVKKKHPAKKKHHVRMKHRQKKRPHARGRRASHNHGGAK